ncbi:MAG: hypothetical protein WCP60_04995 [bacterium]
MSPYSLCILVSAWLVCTGWILSMCHQLCGAGYLVSLALLTGTLTLWKRLGSNAVAKRKWFPFRVLWRRFRRPLPLVYCLCLLIACIGGSLHAPNNYDALCYRLPRVLHWWSENQWHWIGGANDRMDFSAVGFEWLMAPLIILFKSDRLLFLINLIPYGLLPGLIYSAFTQLGVSKRVAWCWMWILPTAYCFALQAGSIGNDSFATVYFLSAIVFARWARRRNSFAYAALALISAALISGAKATNLPLLLPLALVMVPLFGLLISRPIGMILILAFAITVSFLPIAVFTTIHTGDWSGDPKNRHQVKLNDPIAGVIGNSIQIGVGAIAPPILPSAKIWNAQTLSWLRQEPLRSIRNHFPRLDLSLGELPMEEAAGLGLGITLLLLLSLGAILLRGKWGVESGIGFLFGALCWVALGGYMAKLGSESSARLIAAYYPGLLLPVLVLQGQRDLVRTTWWCILALFAQLAVLPALILSPARPIFPVDALIGFSKQLHLNPAFTERIRSVYSVYAKRNDQLGIIRQHIPIGSKKIGFAGGGNESEYSLWRPFGERKVIDVSSVSNTIPAVMKGLDCIVGSDVGIKERYNLSAKALAHSKGIKIGWEEKVAIFAGKDPDTWYVIEPSANK